VERESSSGETGYLRFAVSDTGIGIPEEKLARVFGSFTQVDASTTRQYGGSGLGLTIAKYLVEEMGGRIWVESMAGAGSTFYFLAAFRMGREPATQVELKPLDLKGLRTLIVDDNSTNRLILAEALASWGAFLTTAENGAPDDGGTRSGASSSDTEDLRRRISVLEQRLGSSTAQQQELQRWAEQLPALSDAEDSQKEWSAEYMAQLHATPQDGSLRAKPLIVLARAEGHFGDGLDVPAAELEADRIRLQSRLALLSSNGWLIMVHSGHNMHLEAPDAVADAIKSVVLSCSKAEK